MAKRKSDRKAEIMEIVKEKEAEKAAQEAAAAPEDEEKEVVVEVEETEATEKSETAGPKLVGKRKGRAPNEGKSLKRLLIFISDEDLERLKEDGRPLSVLGREAIKEWLERNQR